MPFQLERDEAARDYIARVLPPGAYALLGGDRFVVQNDEVTAASNSLFALDAAGRSSPATTSTTWSPSASSPPSRGLFGLLGFGKLVNSLIDFSPGPGRQLVSLPDLPAFSPLICYEAAFPGQAALRVNAPAWLLNITNDAWFGRSSGPYQHLAMARMRAIEEGLPLARAANTGISALIDPFGRVLARLGLDEPGILDVRLPQPLPLASPARRAGPALLSALLLLAGLGSFAVERRCRSRPS